MTYPLPRPGDDGPGKARRDALLVQLEEAGLGPAGVGKIIADIINDPKAPTRDRLRAIETALDLMEVRPQKKTRVEIDSEQRLLRLTFDSSNPAPPELLDLPPEERRRALGLEPPGSEGA